MRFKFFIFALTLAAAVAFAACEDKPSDSDSQPKLGTLVVLSVPTSADIYVDGKNTGRTTPDTLLRVSVGSHAVMVTHIGYLEYTDTVAVTENSATIVDAALKLKCPGETVGELGSEPQIEIIGLQPGQDTVWGLANNTDASNTRVILWARTDMWYIQPLVSHPYTIICGDGSWSNWTHPWDRMVALLVDTTYSPQPTSFEHPSTHAGVLNWDEYPAASSDRTVSFGGYGWRVKKADLAGPGPNYFSDSDSSVWIDDDGLHLRTRQQDDIWYCAEIFLDHSLGYGEYSFQLSTRVDSLDDQAVFAGFVYESNSREIDIEFSRVLASPKNVQYVVQPYYQPGNLVTFDMPSFALSSHRFIWAEDTIKFTSWEGLADEPELATIIHSWTYSGDWVPPEGGERMRFNLWLFEGKPPLSGHGDEVIVKSFSYRGLER